MNQDPRRSLRMIDSLPTKPSLSVFRANPGIVCWAKLSSPLRDEITPASNSVTHHAGTDVDPRASPVRVILPGYWRFGLKRPEKVGLWMIGACGSVGGCVALGVAALRHGLASTTGLVSALPLFESAGLVDPGRIVIGGHEVRGLSVSQSARQLHERSGLFDEAMLHRCAADLRAVDKRVVVGTTYGTDTKLRDQIVSDDPRGGSDQHDRSAAEALERLTHDMAAFHRNHRLDQVVVINVASCEAHVVKPRLDRDFAKLQKAMARRGASAIPTSSLYALAAIESGCGYVNFTPSLGIELPAVRRRADDRGICYVGRDGKTGETLVKSVLAPMFAMRNLNVLSWVGHNMLGNRDGAILRDARVRRSKIRSKDSTISEVVGYKPVTCTSIEYVPSLDDWKVAWDFIHFEGFLGTKMNMQFTWQGSDSALAAPLVIDLARLTALEQRNGAAGVMKHLACFFKAPMDVKERDHFTQWQRLVEHVGTTRDV